MNSKHRLADSNDWRCTPPAAASLPLLPANEQQGATVSVQEIINRTASTKHQK
jgi:hypothetical protein